MTTASIRMRPERLAWLLAGLFAFLTLVDIPLQYANSPGSILGSLFDDLVVVLFMAVGVLIVARLPRNSIGWIFCAGGLASAVSALLMDLAVLAVFTSPGSILGGLWLDLAGEYLQGIGFVVMIPMLLLLFPDGHLPSRRWRPVLWLDVSSLVLFALSEMLSPTLNNTRFNSVSNPLQLPVPRLVGDLAAVAFILPLVAGILLGAIAVFVRFRRSRGEERLQIKWLAYSGVVSAVLLVITVWLTVLSSGPLSTDDTLGSMLWSVSIMGVPLAVGVAILKYRLYDMDIIINRTLVYGSLTTLLALMYFGLVLLLEALTQPLTGQEHNDLVIVVSTLIIAALFMPLRRWIQAFIDRRFYRRKYDAALTLASFSEGVRDEVDLEDLTGRLVQVVDETMQPGHVSLWLSRHPMHARPGAREAGK